MFARLDVLKRKKTHSAVIFVWPLKYKNVFSNKQDVPDGCKKATVNDDEDEPSS